MPPVPIGRDALLDELHGWLDTCQVVVLVGPPGIGKSTVAAALGASLWVPAEGAEGPEALVGRAARALGLAVEREAAVLDALAGEELVVIDGYELGPHALDGLLAAWSARTRVVVTSRTHLPAWAPHLEVGPLEPAEGAAAFRAHVRDPRRAEALDDAALQALSTALDGVPLALALVAERLRLYPPDALLAQVEALDEAPERGLARSLADALSLRLTSLSPAGRRALEAAAHLPGRFDVGTLAAVVGEEVDEAVLELLDASLVHGTTASPPRLKVLAPVRASLLRTAGPEAREQVLARLADHVLPEAEAAARAGTPADLERLGTLRGLLEALTHSAEPATRLRAALALAARERRTGPAQAILARDEALPDEGPDALCVRWGLMVARTACGALKADVAEAVLDRVAARVDATTRADERSARSFLALVRGDAAEAAALAREAIALSPDPSYSLRLGVALFELGEQEAAASAFQQARQDTDPFRRGHATYGLCTALMEQQADARDVLQVVQEAELEGAAAYPWLACRLHFLRGTLLADLGQLAEARTHFEHAADLHRVLGEGPSELFMRLNALSLDLAEGRVPEAVLQLPPAGLGAFGRAILGAWKAVVHAVLGHDQAAEAVGEPSLQQLDELQPREARLMRCLLAVAVASRRPAWAAELLPDGVESLVAMARQAVEGVPVRPGDRLSERILAGVASLSRRRCWVARVGSAFLGEDGQRVDIARRKVLCRVLATLATADEPLDVDGLCAAVWPGEKLVGHSGTRRVHVAISTLRGLGLREAIETDVTGDATTWRLDADVVDAV